MSEPSTSNTSLPWWHWRRISLPYKRRARRRMKAAAERALEALDKALQIAGEAAGDTGVPGLAGALAAVRIVLQKIQAMKTNVEGVDSLAANVASLRTIVEEFFQHREGQQISKDTLDQIAELETTWSEIAQKASDIKSRGRVRRFFASNTDAKKLEGFVKEISTSIHEKFMLRSILNTKEDVHVVRQNVEVLREDVRTVQEDVELVADGIEEVYGDVQMIRRDVEVVHEDIEVINGDVRAVREDTEVVREDVEIVREDIGIIREDVEVVLEGVGALSKDVQVVQEDVTAVREDVQVTVEDIGAIREDMEVISKDVGAIREDVDAVREDLEKVGHDVKVISDASFMTTYAKNAQYNAGGVTRRSCLEGTRVNVLDRLLSWITAACTRTKEITESVFWISGLAGTGKTTIAVSVAESSAKQNFLAANFFCSRSDAECSNPNLIFPTLSRQLCHFHAPFREKVAEILKRNPDVIHANPLLQIEELIVKPLEAVKDTFPTSVIVLDALDECVDKEATSIILTAIAKFILRIAGSLLFVVTSRPERHITTLFERNTLKDVTTPLLLHKIELESVLDDVRRFLADGLAPHSENQIFIVDEGWPAAQDVNKLAEMSGGLFIWAATALLFIMDRAFCDPQERLKSLLATASTSRPQETILDSLYDQIANAALSNIAPTLSNRLRSILGALAVAQEPLSVGTLSSFLEFSESVVRNALIRLSSVLHIPDLENPAETIHIIHLTFPEFLFTSSPTKPDAFHITASDHHLVMFTRCMILMRGLRRNIANIQSPSTFKSEILGLDETVEKCIPPSLAYACRYWCNHLAQCVGSTSADSSYDIFHEFLYHHYLHWLEACNLLGYVEEAVNGHRMVLQTCKTLGGRFADLTPLLVDCQRFALTYAACVGAAPLQLYHSALAVAPTNSLVRNAYAQDRGASLIVCRGARSEWAPCLGAFMGHESDDRRVFAVAFSPHGDCFVTGGWDHKLRIWRPTTRTMMLAFGGHLDKVACLAFSPDGAYIASGSRDHDVRVWQVSTGQCVQTLPHTSAVEFVAYSGNGRRILSVAIASGIKLWDSSNGNYILILHHRDDQIRSAQAGISPDGDVIAYGKGDSVYLHNVSSATSEALKFPGQVDRATISPDGRYVAADSTSWGVVQVWQLADRSLVRTINIPIFTVRGRLVFSPDGVHIGYGSRNGSVYLWQVLSEALPRVLRGHIESVGDLSWSPDGLWVVSVSSDKTIRVWDITQPSTDVVSQHHPTATGPVRFVLVRYKGGTDLLHLPSPTADIARIAALASALPEGAPALMPFADIVDAWDARLQIVDDMAAVARAQAWAAVAGQRVNIAQGKMVRPGVSVSRDCSLMACRSPNSYSRVDIYDLQTGAIITSLAEITDGLWFTVFSPDGSLIVTCSLHGSVQMWNPTTGVRLHSFKHNSSIRVLAFSADGHLVVLGSDDEAAHVLDATTGQVVRVLKSHRDRVMEVAFAAGNTHILTLDGFHWFYIWDMETGVCVCEISLNDNSWIHGLNLSPDGTGILVAGDDHHEARTLSLWEPGSRSWPVYLVSREGWLYAKGPGRTARLCWLPLEWRNVFSLGGGRLCAPDYSQKRAVVLDVSQLPDYVGLGPE